MIGLLPLPLRARLVSESEVAKLEEKRERVRREYEPKIGFIAVPAREKEESECSARFS